jgi:hypothetical protein
MHVGLRLRRSNFTQRRRDAEAQRRNGDCMMLTIVRIVRHCEESDRTTKQSAWFAWRLLRFVRNDEPHLKFATNHNHHKNLRAFLFASPRLRAFA